MEWSRGAQAVFQNWSLKVEHASRAVLNSTKYAGRIKGLIRPPSKKKKEIENAESQMKVKTCLELHSSTVIQCSPEQLK